jgi:lipopolysaccharide export LptBFGC system permease protein LptF
VEVGAGELALPVDLGALVSSRSDALPPVLASATSELLAGAHGATGRYHLHRRLALPAASFAILVMAVLFFVVPSLRRPQVPAAVTASALVVFHALARAGEESSISGLLDPLTAAWLPAAVLGIAALATLWLVVRARAPSRAASS